jgi:hypothetical protein
MVMIRGQLPSLILVPFSSIFHSFVLFFSLSFSSSLFHRYALMLINTLFSCTVSTEGGSQALWCSTFEGCKDGHHYQLLPSIGGKKLD